MHILPLQISQHCRLYQYTNVDCSYVLAFQDQTPIHKATITENISEKIFSVIVDCSYVLAFQDQTPSQSEETESQVTKRKEGTFHRYHIT